MLHLLQVCNVGRIVGGTAACAWTITRAFPDCKHSLLFFNSISADTKIAFSDCNIQHCKSATSERVQAISPDLVILHNTSASRIAEKLPAPTLQYLHSRIQPAQADTTVCCSQWLADRYANSIADVLYQPVPRPLCDTLKIHRTDAITIGRICTPTDRKWPEELIPFYSRLATDFPDVCWEFVGCPAGLQPALFNACGGRAIFHEATWQARRHFRNWDMFLYHHPTLTESFGRTVAEAMRAGCIPIVDDRGGFREQVTPESGFLCKTTSDFAHALEQLHNTPLRLSMSQACQQHADDMFSLTTFRKSLLTLLRAE